MSSSPRSCHALALMLALAATVARGADEPTRLPEYFVPGERVGSLQVSVPRGDLNAPDANLGQDLLAIPGVYGHARAADAMEPNIRGLGLDRIATTLNGMPLVNGSPERTNSPVVTLGPAAVTSITVIKALPSVTLGPATTGGAIALDSAAPTIAADHGGPAHAQLSVTYNGGREGVTTQARVSANAGEVEVDATCFANDLGDYTAADGRRVAARLEDHGASTGVTLNAGGHQLRAEFLERRLVRQETLALPLDAKNTESDVMTLNDRWTLNRGALQRIEWRAGFATTDPYITGEDRRGAGTTFANATARSTGAGATSVWRTGADASLALGADYAWQDRRAVRTTPAGQDYIWPDAVYRDAGLFAEWNRPLAQAWRLRLGARGDVVRSDARDADRPALGQPLRQQFVTYNGPGAAVIAHEDHVGAANALLEWKPRHDVSAFIGAGHSVMPGGVMERYRAFLNALGGDGRGHSALELGNPALRAERKSALEAGGTWRSVWADVEATAYAYRIDDFILRTAIGTTLPPLAPMVVYGYRNVDADLAGAEAGVTLKPADGWRVPMTFAVASGRNRTAGVDLAEIPPWEATAAVRYRGELRRRPIAAELGARIVGAKENPTPIDNPLFGSTGGFSVWHARMGATVARTLKIQAGVENLLDHRYTEYLSPAVAPFPPASGDLLPGQRIPAPGRFAWVSVTTTW